MIVAIIRLLRPPWLLHPNWLLCGKCVQEGVQSIREEVYKKIELVEGRLSQGYVSYLGATELITLPEGCFLWCYVYL